MGGAISVCLTRTEVNVYSKMDQRVLELEGGVERALSEGLERELEESERWLQIKLQRVKAFKEQ